MCGVCTHSPTPPPGRCREHSAAPRAWGERGEAPSKVRKPRSRDDDDGALRKLTPPPTQLSTEMRGRKWGTNRRERERATSCPGGPRPPRPPGGRPAWAPLRRGTVRTRGRHVLTDGPRPLNPGNGSCKATQNRLIPASRRPEERGASSQGRETRSPGRFPNEGSKTNAQRRGGRTGGGPRRPGSGDSSLLTVHQHPAPSAL